VTRKLVLLLLCFYCPVASAGFWGAVGACFTDPCNCGDSNKTRIEKWDGENHDKGNRTEIAPHGTRKAEDIIIPVLLEHPLPLLLEHLHFREPG
jgi:hypothetical protein